MSGEKSLRPRQSMAATLQASMAALAGASLLALASQSAWAQGSADNTGMNAQNRASAAPVADDQKQDATDLDLTKRIRASVVRDKALSSYAHNVKIIAVNGTVTLNGVVRSDREKQVVAAKAEKIAGEDHVVNDLTIAPPR
jgi:osmotically-inducible protein OsmY